MKYENLHNHTNFSDGRYSAEEVIIYAISSGLEGIGITDHYRTRKVRSITNLKNYFKELSRLKKEYFGEINIYAGLEIDFSPRSNVYDLISEIELLMDYCDYLLFEYVADELWGGYGIEDFFKIRELLYDIPIGLAHTFIERDIIPRCSDAGTKFSKKNVFIELCPGNRNVYNGCVNYVHSFDFISDNKDKLFFSIGSDTHHDLTEIESAKSGYEFAKSNGLKLFSPNSKMH